jgi:MFS family permease
MSATPQATQGASAAAETPREWESRVGRPVGAAAVAGAGILLASFIIQLPLLQEKSKNEAETLRSVNKHATAYVVGGVLQLIAVLLIGVVLWYLFRAARHRREQTMSAALILGIIGPIAFGIAGAISPFVLKHLAAEFVALPPGQQVNDRAKDLVSGSAAQTLGYVTPAAGLAFVFGIVLGNLNSIRAGLLSSFIGIVGIIAAVLFILPLGPPQILMAFWLVAVATIIFDRWPGGRGPAWNADEPIRWPTAAERRIAAGGGTPPPRRGGLFRPPPPQETEPEPTEIEAPDSEQVPMQQRTSRKRKRKKGRKH